MMRLDTHMKHRAAILRMICNALLPPACQARQTRMVDGVMLGMMDTVVDEDGVFIAPSKMTTAELEVREWILSAVSHTMPHTMRCVQHDDIGGGVLQSLRYPCSLRYLCSLCSLQIESEANGLPIDGLTRTHLLRQVSSQGLQCVLVRPT